LLRIGGPGGGAISWNLAYLVHGLTVCTHTAMQPCCSKRRPCKRAGKQPGSSQRPTLARLVADRGAPAVRHSQGDRMTALRPTHTKVGPPPTTRTKSREPGASLGSLWETPGSLGLPPTVAPSQHRNTCLRSSGWSNFPSSRRCISAGGDPRSRGWSPARPRSEAAHARLAWS
jgi:hypothetical protein